MIIEKTSIDSIDLQYLIGELDQALAITDGEEHEFYHQFNGLDELEAIYVGYIDEKAICCGGYKMQTYVCTRRT